MENIVNEKMLRWADEYRVREIRELREQKLYNLG
jgi:hypothetical protein